jgi:hypothetical protein
MSETKTIFQKKIVKKEDFHFIFGNFRINQTE